MNYVAKEAEDLLKKLLELAPNQFHEVKNNIDGLLLAVNSQQEKLRKYAELVRKTRNMQTQFFRTSPDSVILKKQLKQEAINLEHELDAETEEHISGAKQIKLSF